MRRKFRYDKQLGKTVEVTPDSERAACDEVSASMAPFRKPLEFGSRGYGTPKGYPYASEAMAIDTEDLGYAREVLAEQGVKTEYDRLGRPIMRDRAHRKAHMRALGFYDRSAGYGDAEPLHFNSDFKR